MLAYDTAMKISDSRSMLTVILGGALFLGGMAYGAKLQPSTQKDLLAAMKGEAFAYAKYTVFADEARAHGHPNVAALFERTAKTELTAHFATHALQYGLVRDTAANLRNAIDGENYESTSMYPHMATRARSVGDSGVAAIFTAVGKDEAVHRDRFKAALAALRKKGGR